MVCIISLNAETDVYVLHACTDSITFGRLLDTDQLYGDCEGVRQKSDDIECWL